MVFIKKNLPAIVAFVALLALIVMPSLVFGQQVQYDETDAGVGGVMARILRLLNFFITILMVAAIAFFIFGVVRFAVAQSTEKKAEAKSHMINGLIGLFIIVAFWGIIRIVQNTFNLDNGNQIQQNDIGCIIGVTC